MGLIYITHNLLNLGISYLIRKDNKNNPIFIPSIIVYSISIISNLLIKSRCNHYKRHILESYEKWLTVRKDVPNNLYLYKILYSLNCCYIKPVYIDCSAVKANHNLCVNRHKIYIYKYRVLCPGTAGNILSHFILGANFSIFTASLLGFLFIDNPVSKYTILFLANNLILYINGSNLYML